jgi:mRNA interferase RelE/StbE
VNSIFDWKIYFKPRAVKDLKGLPRNLQKRIADKMRFFVSSGRLVKFSKHLKDRSLGGYRFRVGNYRVIADITLENRKIVVLKIGKRDEVYK